MTMLLSACATLSVDKSSHAVYIAAIPVNCEDEFNRFVRLNNIAAMDQRTVVKLILDLDQSQKVKSRCGKRIIKNLRAIAGVR